MTSFTRKMEELLPILSSDAVRFYYLILMLSAQPETPTDENLAIVLGFQTEDGGLDVARIKAIKAELSNSVRGWNLAQGALEQARNG